MCYQCHSSDLLAYAAFCLGWLRWWQKGLRPATEGLRLPRGVAPCGSSPPPGGGAALRQKRAWAGRLHDTTSYPYAPLQAWLDAHAQREVPTITRATFARLVTSTAATDFHSGTPPCVFYPQHSFVLRASAQSTPPWLEVNPMDYATPNRLRPAQAWTYRRGDTGSLCRSRLNSRYWCIPLCRALSLALLPLPEPQ